jgi:hypothetical protein
VFNPSAGAPRFVFVRGVTSDYQNLFGGFDFVGGAPGFGDRFVPGAELRLLNKRVVKGVRDVGAQSLRADVGDAKFGKLGE